MAQLMPVVRSLQEGCYLPADVLWALEAHATALWRPTEVSESVDCEEIVQEFASMEMVVMLLFNKHLKLVYSCEAERSMKCVM